MKVRWATRIQNLFTAAKLLALTVIILSGLYVVCQGRLENFEEFWQPTRPINPSRIALAFYSGLFAYAGCLSVINNQILSTAAYNTSPANLQLAPNCNSFLSITNDDKPSNISHNYLCRKRFNFG
ncbi:unnamed protein product [Schistosoma curassoni]|uniref:Uncharacterized protein n=1 Tax=Schistosoma curassoni TaxID=6186 RepID=A0A183JDA3_9TREM|nr:unnamed protein product [Schistosoma curassoni]